jgi:hypothetical protein
MKIRLGQVVLPALLAAGLGAQEREAPRGASTPLELRIVFNRYSGEKRVGSLPYKLLVRPDHWGRVRTGVDFPVKQYDEEGREKVDYKHLGTNIDCLAQAFGRGLYSVDCTFQHSSLFSPESGDAAQAEGEASSTPLFRSFSSQASFLLGDGQTEQYTVAADPMSGDILKIDVNLDVPGSLPAESTSLGLREYKLLATNRGSTMEKELNQEAAAGFALERVDAGETHGPIHEMVVVVSRDAGASGAQRYEYRVLDAHRTSTLQEELDEAAAEGFVHRGQTALEGLGGPGVVVIMERDLSSPLEREEYLLLATQRTSTMGQELLDAGSRGFALRGLSVGGTAAGNEVVAILSRPVAH